jgi:hypothetical protein
MTDERVRTRLAELRREYAAGEAQLRDLVQREAAVRETLLRISGAVQVLEELESESRGAAPGADPSAETGPQIRTVP